MMQRFTVTLGTLSVIVCIVMATPTSFGQPAIPDEGSVFALLTMDARGRIVFFGTAFFINTDGTALTNSHVVYAASHARSYQLLALVGKELYGATIVCASSIDFEKVKVERDVALVKLTFSRIAQIRNLDNDTLIATAHRGPLPTFPAFTVEDDPTPGDHVRVVGFGRTAFTTFPPRWIAEGTVRAADTANDGTPVFQIEFLTRPGPGASGSPVLNDNNRVVGMMAWEEKGSSAYDLMIGGSALAIPCP